MELGWVGGDGWSTGRLWAWPAFVEQRRRDKKRTALKMRQRVEECFEAWHEVSVDERRGREEKLVAAEGRRRVEALKRAFCALEIQKERSKAQRFALGEMLDTKAARRAFCAWRAGTRDVSMRERGRLRFAFDTFVLAALKSRREREVRLLAVNFFKVS